MSFNNMYQFKVLTSTELAIASAQDAVKEADIAVAQARVHCELLHSVADPNYFTTPWDGNLQFGTAIPIRNHVNINIHRIPTTHGSVPLPAMEGYYLNSSTTNVPLNTEILGTRNTIFKTFGAAVTGLDQISYKVNPVISLTFIKLGNGFFVS